MDFLLLVNDKYNFRDYGMNRTMTIIKGDVKIEGNLPPKAEVILKNVKIKGVLEIDIGNGDVCMINSTAEKIIVLSSGTES